MGFGNLKNAQHATSKLRAKYTFEDLDGQPWIECAPATEVNPEFYNRYLKAASKGKGASAKAPTVDMIKAARGRDTGLYAKHVAKDWGGVIDDQDNTLSFSREVCQEFLTLLPIEMFDEFRAWAMDITNFLVDPNEMVDVETISGNSSSD